MTDFHKVLDDIHDRAQNAKELGDYFEKLSKIYFENDDIQRQYYSEVFHYTEWAKQNPGFSSIDIGIDLVAKLRNEEGYAAIQCKCYSEDNIISKKQIDSFISASSSDIFKRLILIDTTPQSLGTNAKNTINTLSKEFIRISISELETSRIDWASVLDEDKVRLKKKNSLRDHQIQALEAVEKGFEEHDRGKLIMACGTGKTFTSLKIAEKLAGKGKIVLYMVPSLSLMSQTLREWKNQCEHDFYAYSACSDKQVGKKIKPSDDATDISISDLAFPATTNAKNLGEHLNSVDREKMIVVFSTYQSIDVISQAQHEYGMPEFDLIICDEAHRTTGVTLGADDESNFVRIHNDEDVAGKKRLYMTATERIYGEKAKQRADDEDATLASMDDEDKFGPRFFHRGFGWAVENNLLTDYKVMVLAVDESIVSSSLQRNWLDGSELKLDDATKIIGCYKALAKAGVEELNENQRMHMKSAIAFCQNIPISKLFEEEFNRVITEYQANEKIDRKEKIDLKVEISHVDGSFNAIQRNEKLNWLSDTSEENRCRILSNVKCLSEGVDVPALDAVIFLHPRKSQTDIVQSVGRVMRKAEGKDIGYVIIPITISPGVSPDRALDDNEKYRAVWQILNALRSHDERLDSTINKIGLGEDVSDRIEIQGILNDELEATTTVVDDIPSPKSEPKPENPDAPESEPEPEPEPFQLTLLEEDLLRAIRAKIVDKCGTRDYWEKWANDIAKIAQQHISRINGIVLNSKSKEREVFLAFLEEIRDDLNPEVSETDAVEMLAQHIITKPVFDVLFKDNKFTKNNAVSLAMDKVLTVIYDHNIENESESLNKFYSSVQRRANDIVTSAGRQQLIVELFDRFFRNSFPHITEKLGIVYTPIEVVDFIINSTNDILKDEFDKSFSSDDVEIIDPFTGTGTFISRLLSLNLIDPEKLKEKYKYHIHANEIVLLAYYIASINIESQYFEIQKNSEYEPFDGMVLTDTFQLYEQEKDMIADLLPDNSNRRTRQKETPVNVIFSNPPYSIGQKSANDNAANIDYPNLDRKIESTYVANSSSTSNRSAYDSYIRAFRWATDRIGDEGIVGFVTNASWIDANALDGFRKNLTEEFNKIYVFNLRGNARTSGEERRKEAGNIFKDGSRSPIAITFLVKNKEDSKKGQIFYYDIGDYHKREKKLEMIIDFKSIINLKKIGKLRQLIPDEKNVWINQGDESFNDLIPLYDKKNLTESIFVSGTMGMTTSRDSWVYNFDEKKATESSLLLMKNYNNLVSQDLSYSEKIKRAGNSVNWSRSLQAKLKKNISIPNKNYILREVAYRPFCKQFIFYINDLIENEYKTPKYYELKNNLTIAVSGVGSNKGFSALMTDAIGDFNFFTATNYFPLLFNNASDNKNDLFLKDEHSYAISNYALDLFRSKYKSNNIMPIDIFNYVYGILHSKEYLEKYKNNLNKELPRIPIVKNIDDFNSFADLGKILSDVHVNFDDLEPYQVNFKEGDLRLTVIDDPKKFFKVDKMRFLSKSDKSCIVYNSNITIENIPLEAYEYILNGKSAIEHVMERFQVTKNTDNNSFNDPNDYANNIINDPKYPLLHLQRIITLSLKTIDIIKSLPRLDIET